MILLIFRYLDFSEFYIYLKGKSPGDKRKKEDSKSKKNKTDDELERARVNADSFRTGNGPIKRDYRFSLFSKMTHLIIH